MRQITAPAWPLVLRLELVFVFSLSSIIHSKVSTSSAISSTGADGLLTWWCNSNFHFKGAQPLGIIPFSDWGCRVCPCKVIGENNPQTYQVDQLVVHMSSLPNALCNTNLYSSRCSQSLIPDRMLVSLLGVVSRTQESKVYAWYSQIIVKGYCCHLPQQECALFRDLDL